MALSDQKYKKRRGKGVSYDWDAADRAKSKDQYDKVMGDGDPAGYLDNIGDYSLLQVSRDTTRISRHGAYDWDCICKAIDSPEKVAEITERIRKAQERVDVESTARSEKYRAQRITSLEEQTLKLRKAAELTAGMLRSDFNQAVSRKEVYGCVNGDWLDDPVAAYVEGAGFGEEVRELAGIKLQITVSLDMSNSMWANDIAKSAIEAFITIGLAIEAMGDEYPGSVFAQPFLFAMGESGKSVRRAKDDRWSNTPKELKLGNYEGLRDCVNYQPSGAGQDTWIHPLLEKIDEWESNESDPGAIRLDLIITDGVLEHPTDVRKADEIQERRDGALQTVLLNFLPESEWLLDSRLPLHCVQYPAHVDNIGGLLRQLLSEFVSVYV